MIFRTNADPHKIIIQLQIETGNYFIFLNKLKHFKCIALIKFLLWCATLTGLLLYGYIHTYIQTWEF